MNAEQAMVDALPYYDKGYDEQGVREAALSLVEEEMRRYRPTKNYLEHLPALLNAAPGAVVVPGQTAQTAATPFETELIRAEFDRLANRLPMEMLSMRRYELPQPPAGKMTDVRSWQEALENAQAQLEHQRARIENLELMTKYGANAWKVYNTVLEKILHKAELNLHEIRKHIQEINWERKQEQVAAGDKLKALEDTWVGLVGRNYEIEQAIIELETELGIPAHHSHAVGSKENGETNGSRTFEDDDAQFNNYHHNHR